jgi:hypothetical protein
MKNWTPLRRYYVHDFFGRRFFPESLLQARSRSGGGVDAESARTAVGVEGVGIDESWSGLYPRLAYNGGRVSITTSVSDIIEASVPARVVCSDIRGFSGSNGRNTLKLINQNIVRGSQTLLPYLRM